MGFAKIQSSLLVFLACHSQTSVVKRHGNAGVSEKGVEGIDNQLRPRCAHPQGHIRLRLVDLLVL